MNRNYQAGRRLEYQVVKEMRECLDYDAVMRTAGSHGPADVIGISKEVVCLVQCKVVSDLAAVSRVVKALTKNPPFPRSDKYIQYIVVKLKGADTRWYRIG